MKLAFIDCGIAGVSGDMLTAALIDAGARARKIKRSMLAAAKPFGGARVEIRRVKVNGIVATRVDVETQDRGGRRYSSILKRLRNLALPKQVKKAVLNAFDTLAIAEAEAHGERLDRLELQEVGSADSIADIVGCLTAAHELGFFDREVLASEVAVGRGIIKISHGSIPLPAPATLKILRGKPIRGKSLDAELITPTGAALLVTLADIFVEGFPAMRVETVGYGAGSRKLKGVPNLVRVCLGDRGTSELETHEISILETDVDDVPGEVIGFAIEKLLDEGALDVSATPTLMKKGRPGFQIRVIARPNDSERLAGLLMLHTGTLGVRFTPIAHRYVLKRESVPIQVKIGRKKFKARVKVAPKPRKLIGLAAEYEDAKKIAEKTDLGLREVLRRIEEIARREIK